MLIANLHLLAHKECLPKLYALSMHAWKFPAKSFVCQLYIAYKFANTCANFSRFPC